MALLHVLEAAGLDECARRGVWRTSGAGRRGVVVSVTGETTGTMTMNPAKADPAGKLAAEGLAQSIAAGRVAAAIAGSAL